MIPGYNKFTKVRIRVPSRSPVHVESESSIDEDNIRVVTWYIGLRAQSPKYDWDQGSEEKAQGSEEWDQGSQGF